MSLGEMVMSLTRNFKTVMIIIQNVTIEDVTFLPEDGKVVYFKMNPKVTTVLELSSKIYLKACNLKDVHEQPDAVQYTKPASPSENLITGEPLVNDCLLYKQTWPLLRVTVFITFCCLMTFCKQLLDAWFDLYAHHM